MALIECPDCGGQLSTEAAACPHCGRPGKPTPAVAPPEVPPPRQAFSSSSGTKGIGCLTIVGIVGVFLYVSSIMEDCRSTKAPVSSLPAYKLMGTQGVIRLVVMPSDLAEDREAHLRVAHHLCSGQRVCQVTFWIDESKAPRTLPMTDAQAAAVRASYNLNKNTGRDGLTCHPFGDPGDRCATSE